MILISHVITEIVFLIENTVFDFNSMMTLTEREEDRLWNGKEYVSLPEGETEEQWKYLNDSSNPDMYLTNLSKIRATPDQVPFEQTGKYQAIEINSSGLNKITFEPNYIVKFQTTHVIWTQKDHTMCNFIDIIDHL